MDEKELWNEIHILQAENSLLRRKLGKGYQDFEYYRSLSLFLPFRKIC